MKRKSEERLALAIVAVLNVIGCMVLGGMIVHAIAADLPIPPRKAEQQQKTPLPKSRPPAPSDRAAGMP